jgi:hypothetical protein
VNYRPAVTTCRAVFFWVSPDSINAQNSAAVLPRPHALRSEIRDPHRFPAEEGPPHSARDCIFLVWGVVPFRSKNFTAKLDAHLKAIRAGSEHNQNAELDSLNSEASQM